MSYQYNKAALGGTFDHFHIGHKHLIDTALSQAREVVIGITQPHMTVGKKLSQTIESYTTRLNQVAHYTRNLQERVTLISLENIYGTTLSDSAIDLLVVSEETKTGATTINKTRAKKGLFELPIVVADLIKDSSGEYISSTRIRSGSINRQGVVYLDFFKKDYAIEQHQRKIFQQPIGKLVSSIDSIKSDALSEYIKVALVGDIVSKTWLTSNLLSNYFITDRVSARKKLVRIAMPAAYTHLEANNQAGQISVQAVQQIIKLLKLSKAHLEVIGEEDLLALPLILSLPLNSLLVYGQPNMGLVLVEIDEAIKEKIFSLLQ